MLIIPYQTRFTAKSLPVVTLALVVINLLVYIVLQSGDQKAYERAADYYFSVQLPQVELPRYAAHLERRSDRRATQVLSVIRSGPSDDEARVVLMIMQRDREFMKEMKAGRVVRSDEPGYAAWREQRDRFQSLMSQVFVERFALEPGSADLLRLFTYQFLHGNAMHLLGNMAILLLAGPFAEAALGRWRFLLAYLGERRAGRCRASARQRSGSDRSLRIDCRNDGHGGRAVRQAQGAGLLLALRLLQYRARAGIAVAAGLDRARGRAVGAVAR